MSDRAVSEDAEVVPSEWQEFQHRSDRPADVPGPANNFGYVGPSLDQMRRWILKDDEWKKRGREFLKPDQRYRFECYIEGREPNWQTMGKSKRNNDSATAGGNIGHPMKCKCRDCMIKRLNIWSANNVDFQTSPADGYEPGRDGPVWVDPQGEGEGSDL